MMKKIALGWLLLLLLPGCIGNMAVDPIDYVDPFIGTGGHGHTYPGATSPYGAVQLSPDTRRDNWDACAGYHYSDSTIIGFSHTHLSGTGAIDLGDILFHPTSRAMDNGAEHYTPELIGFSHKDEKATPGYYSVNFRKEGILAEMTASTYAGVHRYTFRKGLPASLVIDMKHLLTRDELIDTLSIRGSGPNEIAGMRITSGWVQDQPVYFVAQFSQPFKNLYIPEDHSRAVAQFGQSDGTPLVVKVGLSIVSEENARRNLEDDIDGYDFDAVYRETRNRWNEELKQIVVESKNRDQLKNFYTAIYRAKVVPNIMSDVNGQYRRHDKQIASTDKSFRYFSTLSLWDTFRAWHPLMTLIDTVLVNDIIRSMLVMYDATGELPIWPLSSGETGTMIGYHSVSVIADAFNKGILDPDINIREAFRAMKISSEVNRKGASDYIRNGFIPANKKRESVSCLLEFAYDDWCISRVAQQLGYEQDAETYFNRSLSYINVFDGETKFFRGKRSDGNWESPFNPFAPGRSYTEATAWQYRYFVPHDVNGMVQLFGGENEFEAAVDELFAAEERVDGEMADITGMIGQYVQGNEPSHHMAYLYNYVGAPWKTQYWTRRILKELYQPTPDGLSGNEDCGQMSAWYILSSLGIYPLCPGSNQFLLTTPLFEKAEIGLANGKRLIITANDPERNIYINKVILNGHIIENNYITYTQLMEGGELTFELSDEPNRERGTSPETFPASLTTEKVVSIPYTTKDLYLFQNEIEVTLGTATEGAQIYYTLDGTEPDKNALLYRGPFKISNSTLIKAKAFKEGYTPSNTFSIDATKARFRKALHREEREQGVVYTYHEGVFSSVADLLKSKVVKKGKLRSPSIEHAERENHFGFTFQGLLWVPEDGVYDFMTQSDDGSVLFIGNELVVDNDGSHAAITASGSIALEKGFHAYQLIYFQDYEGKSLRWGCRLKHNGDFQQIPDENLFIDNSTTINP
jgi:predicted alpha-1,2-mannosidase